jgi:3-oxoacyl-[acyl-carrier-protein] synthase-1/3-oxoacyl-[acyl-carrier-protein] synthase II
VTPIAVVAAGAVSALGVGERAVTVGGVGEAAKTAIARDEVLAHEGLERPFAARAAGIGDSTDRAAALLTLAAENLVRELDLVLRSWRSLRVSLVIGTSGGGMPSLERALAQLANAVPPEPSLARASFYDGPLSALAGLFAGAPCLQILSACASSTIAIGLGCRWLEAGHADLVVAGGYDALSSFIASGFEALGATSSGVPQPFREARDGMALGEGAGLVALARQGDAPARLGSLFGFGAASDAWHITAPEPSGDGLARAALAALADAACPPSRIELVSAHATATRHNDGSEAAALARLMGSPSSSVAHPYKAAIGHTLGAAGVLELLAALGAIQSGLLPAAIGVGGVESAFPLRLLERNESGSATLGLKLSAAFGGANAALVFGTPLAKLPHAKRGLRNVRVLACGRAIYAAEPELIARSALPELVRLRLDRASALAVSAVADVLSRRALKDPERTACVLGTFAASLEANELYDERRRSGGVQAVQPRRFPTTSPNLPAGQCSIGFGLRGPSLAVGGGPTAALEALLVATDLVAAGDADEAVVTACDDVGATTRALCGAAGIHPPADGALALVVGTGDEGVLIDREALVRRIASSACLAPPTASPGWPMLLAAVESYAEH